MINSDKSLLSPPHEREKKAYNTTYLYSLKRHRGAAAHRPRVLRGWPRWRDLVPTHDVRTENCRGPVSWFGSTVCSGGLAPVCSTPSSTGVWDPRYSFNGMARINPQGENSTTGTIKRTEGRDIFIYMWCFYWLVIHVTLTGATVTVGH